MDKKLQKLEFLRDGYWKVFTKTGNIYDYGKYRGAVQLINEHINANSNSAQPEM